MLLHRVTELFSRHERGSAFIISPYLTLRPLRSIIHASGSQVRLNVVTLISDKVFQSGSSSVEAIRYLLRSPNVNLFSLERLHAKAYLAGGSALVGSANCTDRGLGISPSPNHELLVSVSASSLEVSELLFVIEESAMIVASDSFEQFLLSVESTTLSADSRLAAEVSRILTDDPWLPSSHVDYLIDYLISGSLYRIPVLFRDDVRRDSDYVMLRAGDERALLGRPECLTCLRGIPIIRFFLAQHAIEKYRIWRILDIARVSTENIEPLFDWLSVLS